MAAGAHPFTSGEAQVLWLSIRCCPTDSPDEVISLDCVEHFELLRFRTWYADEGTSSYDLR